MDNSPTLSNLPRLLIGVALFILPFASLPFIYEEPTAHGEKTSNLMSTGDVLEAGEPTKLVLAAIERTTHEVRYDGRYMALDYPMGDVPDHMGVCTDVVIRSYRKLGVDLQVLVHEDMRKAFSKYPDNWGLKGPDSNIDHRRVPNLQTFFTRHGEVLTVSESAGDYKPGDLVTWMVNRSLPHIGIVTHKLSDDGRRPKIVHNIGRGPVLDDMLFDYPITGHYRFDTPETAPAP